jgi:acetyl esterase
MSGEAKTKAERGAALAPDLSDATAAATENVVAVAAAVPRLPGRLGKPDGHLKDDPRADPRMLAAMAPFGMGLVPAPSPVTAASPIEEIRAFCMAAEAGFPEFFAQFSAKAGPVIGVSSHTEVINGVDGNDIKVYVHKPASRGGDGDDKRPPLPCIIYSHGGGMAYNRSSDANYVRLRDELAATGLVVVGAEFRNSAGVLGPNPFPAGLNDCASCAKWVIANRAALGVSETIVLAGESGGGNLALATALKANREGWVGGIAGVYALCPFISNAYADPLSRRLDLASLFENDKYLLSNDNLGALARAYSPDGAHDVDPLAWPLFASAADLAGLPPHTISVNELDPLRDEGLVYFRKLLGAGVSAVGRTVNGTCHAGELLFIDAMPDAYRATIRDIKGFCNSLL